MSSPITTNDPASGTKASVSLEHAIEHFLSDLPDETARRIRLASGIDSPALRAAYRESRQVPALLLDTRLRFELEQEIQDFIDALGKASTRRSSDLYDPPEDSAAAEYGPDLSPSLPRVRIERALVLEGDLWRSVLQQMSPTQRAALLDGEYSTLEAQLSALRQRASSLLSARRQALFDSLYAFRQQSRDPLVNLLRSRIPQLSRSVANELLANSNEHDRQSMSLSEGELSEEQALDAHWYLQEERLSQAYEGLFLESRQNNDDTHRLMLHTLATWPEWPASDVRLELREQTPEGPLVVGIGAPEAEQTHIIVHNRRQFTLSGTEGSPPTPASDLPAALATLPEPLRKRLGLTDRNTILQRLRQLPALSRAHLRALFGLSPVEPSQRLSDDNGYLQDSPSSFASPDELAQRQRTTFDALAATNERTLLLLRSDHQWPLRQRDRR